MWKKEGTPDPAADARPEPRAAEPMAAPRAGGERATIGRSITIRGEVAGDEDLLIQGRIDGSVNLHKHAITIGPEGDVKSDITGRVVTVEGSVVGNLNASEKIILRSSARVQGDLTSPRVVLEDGARFRGGVDMGETAEPSKQSGDAARAQAARTPESMRMAGAAEATRLEPSLAGDATKRISSEQRGPSHSAAQPAR